MRILFISSGNKGNISPFVLEQGNALINIGQQINFFTIVGKGALGYLRNISRLNRKIEDFKPDLLHSHFGLSGLVASLQRKVPVIVTFHGTDVTNFKNNIFSSFANLLSAQSIFVEGKLAEKIFIKRKNKENIIPCGVDLKTFYPIDKFIARDKLSLDRNKTLILFSSSFSNKIKNYPLAKAAYELIGNCELIELKGYTREETNLLLNACDLLLSTSKSEGSPQIIKEAMACNCPIVSTDVGDVNERINSIEGCYICSFNPKDVADKVQLAISFAKRTDGRLKISKFSNEIIAKKIIDIYKTIVKPTLVNE